jgi:hypothetical protein
MARVDLRPERFPALAPGAITVFYSLRQNRRKEGCLMIAGLKVFVEILVPRRNATWIKSHEQWKL